MKRLTRYILTTFGGETVRKASLKNTRIGTNTVPSRVA